jgi:hypothetical protein
MPHFSFKFLVSLCRFAESKQKQVKHKADLSAVRHRALEGQEGGEKVCLDYSNSLLYPLSHPTRCCDF